jgi:hypothetical protein
MRRLGLVLGSSESKSMCEEYDLQAEKEAYRSIGWGNWSGDVAATNGNCLSPVRIHVVRVSWTVRRPLLACLGSCFDG